MLKKIMKMLGLYWDIEEEEIEREKKFIEEFHEHNQLELKRDIKRIVSGAEEGADKAPDEWAPERYEHAEDNGSAKRLCGAKCFDHRPAKQSTENYSDFDEIDSGYMIGYQNAKSIFESALIKLDRENADMRRRNILLRANNASMRERIELIIKEREEQLTENGSGGQKGD